MLIATLLDAIPQQLTVYKCDAHTNTSDPVAIGNARADEAVKLAASFALAITLTNPVSNNPQTGLFSLLDMQKQA